jgi:hypothetical protein
VLCARNNRNAVSHHTTPIRGDDHDCENDTPRRLDRRCRCASANRPGDAKPELLSITPASCLDLLYDKPDPIFAALERHTAAWRAYEDADNRSGSKEGVGVELRTRVEALNDAANALLDIQPTTIEGVTALIQHFLLSSETFPDEENSPMELLRNVADALVAIAGERNQIGYLFTRP